MINQLDIEIKEKEELLAYKKKYRQALEKQFTQIINSKFYKLWQKINKIKKKNIKK